MPTRRLSLKREVLRELAAADLAAVNGAAPPNPTTIIDVQQTAYSCYAYISCYVLACAVDRVEEITSAIAVSGRTCL